MLIEFTTPQATEEHLKSCLKHKIRLVIGTTGLSETQVETIRTASARIPIVLSFNMSIGVNVLFMLAQAAAAKLGGDYTARIVEAHHIHKKDAPSGTAKTLAEKIAQGSGRKVTDIQSIREGEIIGDHEVILESSVDTIKISHSAKTRDIFAKGSLVAVKFLMNKTSGLYSMQDVLGLK